MKAEIKVKHAWGANGILGDRCIVIDCEIENHGTQPISANEFSACIEARQKSRLLDKTVLSEETHGCIGMEPVAPGESADTQIAFVLSDSEEAVTVRWDCGNAKEFSI